MDLHEYSCYNKGAMKDSPISTLPVVSPWLNTKEQRQPERRQQQKHLKEKRKMSKIELLAKIELLNKYEAIRYDSLSCVLRQYNINSLICQSKS